MRITIRQIFSTSSISSIVPGCRDSPNFNYYCNSSHLLVGLVDARSNLCMPPSTVFLGPQYHRSLFELQPLLGRISCPEHCNRLCCFLLASTCCVETRNDKEEEIGPLHCLFRRLFCLWSKHRPYGDSTEARWF